MTEASVGTELRKYRALAWTLVATLIISVALFVQFMRMDRTHTEHTFLSNTEHLLSISGMQIARLLERLETIGRDYSLLGANDTQLSGVIRALDLDKMLLSLCVREGDTVRVLHAVTGAAKTTGARCAAAFSSSRSRSPRNGTDSLATDFRVVPSLSGEAPSLEVRLRDGSTRELRATISSTALIEALMSDSAELLTNGETVCLSLRIDGSFHELTCHGGEIASAVPEAFMATEANVVRLIEKGGLHWRLEVTPHLQSLAGEFTLLPFTMFSLAFLIGAIACVFAYQTTDKNIRIETHAQELRSRLEQLEQLEQQNNLLDQFAAMAAHDLQSPLRFIVSNAHLLIAELEELDQSDLSQMAQKQVEHGMRMRALVVDLLEFCRAGQCKLTTVPVDTQELVSEEVRLLKAHEGYARAEISVGSLPKALICDADKFTRIVRNLLENAVKFSQGSSPPKVSISASRDTLHGPWTFRIKDNGPGVSEEYREVIFRPFARLDATSEGTGMGLAIVKVMLERHGGTIFLDPSDTDGSTFCFTMPGAIPERTPA